jgi:ligand-binding SRPBCC domain-containing protein
MKYQHRFRVQAPVEAVAEFHSYPDTMAAITPPPIFVQVHNAPARVVEGQQMDFTMWLGPLPLRWQAHFEDVTAVSFVDRMVQGPMRTWRHRHSFVAIDDHTTDVLDDVEIELRRHPLWGPVGLGMALNLPVLFAFRQWQTQRLLAQHRESGVALTVVLQEAGKKQRGLIEALGVAALAVGTIASLALIKRARQSHHPQSFSRNGAS